MSTGQPPYVMLGEDGNTDPNGLKPPPYRRNVPRYNATNPHKKKGGCSGKKCCKCICCIYCFLILLVLILVGLAVALFYTVNPKIPTYKVQNMDVAAFSVKKDFSLYTKFVVYVKADNPNGKIAIQYEKDSSVEVTYQGATLSSGHLPTFVQPHNNVTIIPITLSGESTFGSGLQEALMDSKNNAKIPLNIYLKVPVHIKLADGSFGKSILVRADISLVVDSLSPNKKVGILSSDYKVWVKIPEMPNKEHRVM